MSIQALDIDPYDVQLWKEVAEMGNCMELHHVEERAWKTIVTLAPDQTAYWQVFLMVRP